MPQHDAEPLPEPVRRAQYVAAMIRCGWTIDSVPGYLATARGLADVACLREMRADVDVTGVLWFEHAHAAFRDDAV